MTKETFAIARADTIKVALWCRGTEKNFHVINGGWNGSLIEGHVFVKSSGAKFPAHKVWSGVVPDNCRGDYEAAIAWIDEQLRHP